VPHAPQPYFKPSRNTWYVELNRKQVSLGSHPQGLPPPQKKDGQWDPPPQIREAFYRVMADRQGKPATERQVVTVAAVAVIDRFLDWCQHNRAPETYAWYHWRLQRFAVFVGRQLTVDELQPYHLDDWLARYPDWSSGMRHGACRAIQRAFAWAEKQGRIPKSPFRGYEKPRPGRRKAIIAPTEFSRMLQNVRQQPFRDLLEFTWETGARPQESLIAEARHVDVANSRLVFPPDESKGEQWPRIVYLTPNALEVVQRLMLRHRSGPLFRNTGGRPWTTDAVKCAFARLAKKVGKRFCLYGLRHAWLDRALKAGVDALTCAILMGHRDPSTISRVYQHLSQSPEYLLGAARKATS
jgi:integrase